MKQRDAVRQRAHVAHLEHVHIEDDRDDGEQHDGGQRRGNDAGDARQAVDDGKARQHHGIGFPAHAGQLRQLRHEDQDRQRVDETGDD